MKLLTSLLISLILLIGGEKGLTVPAHQTSNPEKHGESPAVRVSLSDTLDTIGRAVIRGLQYKSLYNLELEKSQSFEREIQLRDSLWTAERQTVIRLNEQLTEAVRDKGFSEFHTYLMMILGSAVTGMAVYLIWSE